MKKSDAVQFFGSQRKIAETLGISESAVSRWGRLVPVRRAIKLNHRSDGELNVNLRDYK